MISHGQILESVELTCMLLLLMFTLRSEPGDYWNCFPKGNKFSLPLCVSVLCVLSFSLKSSIIIITAAVLPKICNPFVSGSVHCSVGQRCLSQRQALK